MNPKLWGGLPLELLEMVFAYLSVGEISRLRLRSMEWKQTLDTADCEYYRVCERVGRKMLCLITRSENLFWARVLDTESTRWCTYQINAHHSANLPFDGTNGTAPASSDAGFVLFTTCINFSLKRKESRPSLLISIANPLTMIVDELPTLFDLWDIKLVQLKMDDSSTVFKVFMMAARAQWTSDKGPPSWTSAGIEPNMTLVSKYSNQDHSDQVTVHHLQNRMQNHNPKTIFCDRKEGVRSRVL